MLHVKGSINTFLNTFSNIAVIVNKLYLGTVVLNYLASLLTYGGIMIMVL